MRSATTPDFWVCFQGLPKSVQQRAKDAYRLWRNDPQHPGLHFKRLNTTRALYSVRVGIHYWALGLLDQDVVTWFWIGSHAEYDRLVG